MTKQEMFERYEKVRSEGKYNMITEANYAMCDAGLSREEYFYVIKHYMELSLEFGKKG